MSGLGRLLGWKPKEKPAEYSVGDVVLCESNPMAVRIERADWDWGEDGECAWHYSGKGIALVRDEKTGLYFFMNQNVFEVQVWQEELSGLCRDRVKGKIDPEVFSR